MEKNNRKAPVWYKDEEKLRERGKVFVNINLKSKGDIYFKKQMIENCFEMLRTMVQKGIISSDASLFWIYDMSIMSLLNIAERYQIFLVCRHCWKISDSFRCLIYCFNIFDDIFFPQILLKYV